MKEYIKLHKNLFIAILLFLCSILIYLWTIKLPIIGDGLMHMSDETHFSTIKDFFKIFYTFDGLGKPEVSPTLRFHRPVFDEIIIPIVQNVTQFSIIRIRIISILVNGINVVLAFYLGYLISNSRKIATIIGVLFATNIIYISGIYEFGLSFSLWLTMFSLCAFIFIVKYNKYEHNIDFILSLTFSFLSVFTKESAITLGIALSIYFIVNRFIKIKKMDFKIIVYIICQLLIIILYFFTRYKKLGMFFGIAGGIEGNITIKDSLFKIIGYFFIDLNMPNKVIPEFMIAYLSEINLLIAIAFIFLNLFLIVKFIREFIKYPIKNINVIIGLLMFCILIAPVFKVTRNSQYYGDIAFLGIILIIGSIRLKYKKSIKWIVGTYLALHVICFGLLVNTMVNNNKWYLAYGTNEAKLINEKINQIEYKTKEVYECTSWIKDFNNIYIYNHGEIGSFYKYNIDIDSKVLKLDENNICNLKGEYLILDYMYEEGTNNINVLYNSNYSQLNDIIKIKYKKSENYTELLEFSYMYNKKKYYQKVDLNYQKSQSIEQLYFLVPKGAEINIDNEYIEKIERIE